MLDTVEGQREFEGMGRGAAELTAVVGEERGDGDGALGIEG